MSIYLSGRPYLATSRVKSQAYDFDLTPTYSNKEGRLIWNSDDGTLDIGMPGGNVVNQIGQEIIIRAKNIQGSEIANGKAVYVFGATGSRPTIKLANNTVYDEAISTIAIATESITNNQSGFVTAFGYVRDINTSSFSEGANIYLGENGDITGTQPSLDNECICLGVCIRQHATEGIIFVNIEHKNNKWGDVTGGNYTQINEGLKLFGTDTRWNDLKVDATRIRQGATQKPDFNTNRNTLDFPENDITEIAYFNVQLPHDWKIASTLYPHIHWYQEQNQAVNWVLEYAWINVNSTGNNPPTFTSLSINNLQFTYSSGNLHQISSPSSPIDATNKTLSSMLLCRLYRNNTDNYTGDAGMFEFDFHYEIDSIGSQERFVKT